jgi:hypothetical protein
MLDVKRSRWAIMSLSYCFQKNCFCASGEDDIGSMKYGTVVDIENWKGVLLIYHNSIYPRKGALFGYQALKMSIHFFFIISVKALRLMLDLASMGLKKRKKKRCI